MNQIAVNDLVQISKLFYFCCQTRHNIMIQLYGSCQRQKIRVRLYKIIHDYKNTVKSGFRQDENQYKMKPIQAKDIY